MFGKITFAVASTVALAMGIQLGAQTSPAPPATGGWWDDLKGTAVTNPDVLYDLIENVEDYDVIITLFYRWNC